MFHLAPSMLCADQLALGDVIHTLDDLGIDWFHIDVMDGSFVPNFAIGTDCLRAMTATGRHPFYAHMMVTRPQDYIEPFAALGVDTYCFHLETTHNPFRLCQAIRAAGMKPAAALNPATPAEALRPLLPCLHGVTLMAVEPGFSGQTFLPHTLDKIRDLRAMAGEHSLLIEVDGGADPAISRGREYSLLIEVDGGADPAISRACVEAGCDVVVGGYFSLFDKAHSIPENHRAYLEAMRGV